MKPSDYMLVFIVAATAILPVGLGYVVGYWRGWREKAQVKEPGFDRSYEKRVL